MTMSKAQRKRVMGLLKAIRANDSMSDSAKRKARKTIKDKYGL